ncbi:TRAP transporter small permease [Hydrogenophaga sp. 2FB]|uniref:TRAP transporter small permease n=1 Tax=Hydrogenophaga sp. 2FB TaxID=2502187 RepID=UPI00207BBE51|nr:TRAP transporter small permease [Hydrogenophaga sp. 2FB]
MTRQNHMRFAIDFFCRGIERLVVGILATMVLLVFGNVVLRYAFNSGITVSEELSRWLFVWMIFLGAIVAVKEQRHLGTDVLVSRLPPAGRKACLLIAQLLMLWVHGLLLSGAWTQAHINWDVRAPVSGLSAAIFYASGIVFAAAAGFLLLRQFWHGLTGRLDLSDLTMVQDSEDQIPGSAPQHLGEPSR